MLLQALLAFVILAAMVGAAVRFHYRQNMPRKRRMDRRPDFMAEIVLVGLCPRCLVLSAWVFAFAPGISCAFRAVLLIHVTIWWCRGAIEAFMIYRWYNWSPVYGITHDGFHLAFSLLGTAWAAGHVSWPSIIHNPANLHAFIVLATAQFAITAEAVFAGLFIATRGTSPDKTKIVFRVR